MKKDKFYGHSVKRPYLGGLGKYWKRQNNKAVRRLPVDSDLPEKSNMHHRVHPATSWVKFIGDDCGDVKAPHDYCTNGYFDRWTWVGGAWVVWQNNEKIDAVGENIRVKLIGSDTFFLK